MKKDYRALWLLLIFASVMTYIVIVCQSDKPSFKSTPYVPDTVNKNLKR